MCQPIVSIIITCFNKADFIKESIESALNQTYKNIEILCVNDCSSDDSNIVIRNYIDKPNFIYIDNPKNIGVIESRNNAIDIAKGEYILPLDGDDTLEPTFVEKCISVIQKNHNISWVYTKTRFIDEKSCPMHQLYFPKFDLEKFAFQNCIVSTAIFKKSDFIAAGKYKSYMKFGCEDFDLWITFVENGITPYRIEEFLFNYRQVSTNSRNKTSLDNSILWKRELIKHHFQFYFDKNNFVRNIFEYHNLEKLFEKKTKKYLKYKMLFNVTLILLIFSFLALFLVF